MTRAARARNRFDVIVVGGGHNGLVAAGLLARRGLTVVVLERRSQVGGAAITEQPWGPDYKVSALSYVVSSLPPAVVQALDLERHGYRVFPQHGYFAPMSDGRYLQLPDDAARRRAEVAKFSAQDAATLDRWEAWIGRLRAILGPMLLRIPPRVGSKQFRDLWAQVGLAWSMRSFDVEAIGDLTRLMTMSVSDLLDDFFESPQIKGVMSVSGVIGAWAGPRTPGTAFVMAHHKIGAWGFPEGGMGGVTGAMRRAAEALGVVVRTAARVERILVRDGRVTGAVLDTGEELVARTVVSTTHPKITFVDHLERSELPDGFVGAIDRWKSRSGTVKINLAVDRLPQFACKPGDDPEVHGGTIVLAESVDYVEQAFQDAAAGRPSSAPFADICIPSVYDRTLAPAGRHIVSVFTQWVPHGYSDAPHTAEIEAYADRVIARVDAVAPGFTDSILRRQVIGPYEMERTYGLIGGNIFHGELSPNQLFHMRPVPGYADFRTPISGLYNASSASHGGGGVTAIPALQVVKQIIRDR